jgi:hypothetical protein
MNSKFPKRRIKKVYKNTFCRNFLQSIQNSFQVKWHVWRFQRFYNRKRYLLESHIKESIFINLVIITTHFLRQLTRCTYCWKLYWETHSSICFLEGCTVVLRKLRGYRQIKSLKSDIFAGKFIAWLTSVGVS